MNRDEASRRLRSPLLPLDRLAPDAARRLRRSRLRALVVGSRNRGLRPGDVILGSYPRSGSTWLRLLLAHLLTGADTGLRQSEFVVPMVGFEDRAETNRAGVRVVRSHEPYQRAYRRAVYLVRDARDVALSYHALYDATGRWDRGREEFMAAFARGEVDGYGPWQDHVMTWLAARDRAELLVIRYEDLLSEPADTLAAIASFCGISAARDQIADAVAANSVDRVRGKEFADAEFLRELGWRMEGDRRPRATRGGWRFQLGPGELSALTGCGVALRAAGYDP
jgi:hypothetical protein